MFAASAAVVFEKRADVAAVFGTDQSFCPVVKKVVVSLSFPSRAFGTGLRPGAEQVVVLELERRGQRGRVVRAGVTDIRLVNVAIAIVMQLAAFANAVRWRTANGCGKRINRWARPSVSAFLSADRVSLRLGRVDDVDGAFDITPRE